MSKDFVEEAKELYKSAESGWSKIYDKALEDQFFLSDDPFAQWDEKDYNERVRTGRPALTIDNLGQFVHQVANDIRMNTPTIKVIPSDMEASDDVAEVLRGIIREIEYRSNADDVYDTASLNSVKSSIGFIRIDHEYVGETFEQQLVLHRVVNPLSVYLDPSSIECDGRDAKYAIILDKVSVGAFKEQYPESEPVDFTEDKKDTSKLKDEEEITIAECFKVVEEVVTIKSESDQTRDIVRRKVMRYKVSGKETLEQTEFPSKFIPIIPVYGEEAWVNGERQIYSLIRKSKQAQRMFNYWKSLETELLMKAPQAPVMAQEGQVDDYADDWMKPSKAMVLRYKGTDVNGQPIAPPQRLEPPTIPTGIVNASRQTVDDIKATMGIYNAGLGQMGNEISGIAIKSKQGESDTATYHFADNLVRSITHVGRILTDAIPNVYDTPRILKIVGVDDAVKSIGVNGEVYEDQQLTVNLNKGSYDVRVVTGPSFSTLRQESAEFYNQLVTAQPELMKIMGDLLFKNMDFAGADDMAERIKTIMDPAVLGDEEQDPQVIAMQKQMQAMAVQLEQSQGMNEALQQQLLSKQGELELKAKSEVNDSMDSKAKIRVQLIELEQKQKQAEFNNQIKAQELSLEADRLALEKLKVAKEYELKELELQAEALQKVTPSVGMTVISESSDPILTGETNE